MEELKKQNMDNFFCPYEQALALKELGFDEPCFAICNKDRKLFIVMPTNEKSFEYILIPTFSQAFRWFRKKYGLQSNILSYPNGNDNHLRYFFSIERYINYILEREEYNCIRKNVKDLYKSYEDAEIECLKKLIEIIKKKK